MSNAAEMIALDRVRNRLATLWLGASGLIVIIVGAETMLGVIDKSRADSVWAWLLPTFMPIVGIIISTLAGSALQSSPSPALVRKSFYRIAFWLSALYLVLILASIIFRQSIAVDTESWLDKLQTSNLWLAPVQGVVALVLGIPFTSAKHH